MESLLTPPKRIRFAPSQRLSERKRALFPSQKDTNDCDLGHMSPLEYSSSPEPLEDLVHNKEQNENVNKSLEKSNVIRLMRFSPQLEIIDDLENSVPLQTDISNVFSPKIIYSPRNSDDCVSIPETPVKSPNEILKTPHDTTNTTNLELPRLIRKSLVDITNFDTPNQKQKTESISLLSSVSPVSSPEESLNKSVKFDHSLKIPKARTALFTENIMFPAKSFYPKVENNKQEFNYRNESNVKMKAINSKQVPLVYLCNRTRNKNTRNRKKYFGQINAGVRHGIKKPKHKPTLTKTQLLKAALNIVKNSPLNDLLDDWSETQSICSENGVSLEQVQKMDSILKNIDNKSLKCQPLQVFQQIPNKQPKLSKTNSLKRSLSPEPELDHSKKFFKIGHTRATVTISNNIKLKVDHGEYKLIEKQNKIVKPKLDTIDFNMDELFNDVNNENENLNDILKSLENDNNINCSSASPSSFITSLPVLNNKMSQNIADSKNISNMKNTLNITSSDLLLSPTSLLCDVTSGLALDSPKQSMLNISSSFGKVSTLKKRISFPETMDQQNTVHSQSPLTTTKLFPIFYGKQNQAQPVIKESKHVKNIRKMWKPLSEDQSIIDAGQKRFGLTQCTECKCMYSQGEPEDEIMHYNHHNSIGVLKYNGWKHERVVHQFSNGKVILVNHNDPKNWWKKIRDLLEIINRDLGFVDVPFDQFNKKVFLCIMNKQITGCLIAEPKLFAHKMIPLKDNKSEDCSDEVDKCTEEQYPVKCGVSRLWVVMTHRKKGVATCMMNALRSNFMYGHILSTQEIAFSAPTAAGKQFAAKYTNTQEFLIYTS